MAWNPRTSRIVPVALGVAMVALIVATASAPNVGAVPAQSSCEYNQCVGNTGLPWWVFAAIAILIVAALAAALVLLRRRRRPPPSGLTPYTAAGGPAAGAMGRGPTAPPPGGPNYIESPEDVGATLPNVPPPPPPTGGVATGVVAGAAVGAGAGAVAADAEEPDIDSLMAELDKISGEILKRPKNVAEKKPPSDE